MTTSKKSAKRRRTSAKDRFLILAKLWAVLRPRKRPSIFERIAVASLLAFGATTAFAGDVVPDWSKPQTPHHSGTEFSGAASGVINLGAGGTYDGLAGIQSGGYDGSKLTYFFNDYDDYLKARRATLIAAQTQADVSLVAASTGAVVAAGVDPTLLSKATWVAQAVFDEAVAAFAVATTAADLGVFDSWEYDVNHVGAIEYNSSLTVNGYGTLKGAYQNIETFQLTNSSDDSVNFRDATVTVVDAIKSKGDLFFIGSTVDAVGVLDVAKSIDADAGTAMRVDELRARKLLNSGKIYVDSANVAELVDNAKYGTLIADAFQGNAVANAGSLTTRGFATFDSFVNRETGYWNLYGATKGNSIDNAGMISLGSNLSVGGVVKNSGLLQGSDAETLSAQSIVSSGAISHLERLTTSSTLELLSLGRIANVERVKVGGDLVANGGFVFDVETLVVSGASKVSAGAALYGDGSPTSFFSTNGLCDESGGAFAGTVSGFANVSNKKALENLGSIGGTGAGSVYRQGEDLSNFGRIGEFERVEIAASATNALGALIKGMGAGFELQVGGALTNSGTVLNFERLSAKGSATNASEALIKGTGAGSAFQVGDSLTNLGVVQDYERAQIGGYLTNARTIQRIEKLSVGGYATNSAGGAITGTGAGSSFDVGEYLTNSGVVSGCERAQIGGDLTNAGTIRDTEMLSVGGYATNNAGGKIAGTGSGSAFDVGRDLRNDGVVQDYERAQIGNDFVNSANGLAVGSGKNSSWTVGGALENAGRVEEVEKLAVKGAATNGQNAALQGTGTNSELEVDGKLQNLGEIDRYESVFVGGDVEIGEASGSASQAFVVGTGAGSKWETNGTLTNDGLLAGFESFASNGTGDSVNRGAIYGIGGSGESVDRGVEYGSGQTVGNSGGGSHYRFAGNLTNELGATVANVESLAVGGDLTNRGALSFVSDVVVDGKFANEEATDESGKIVGGVLDLRLQDGEIGKITVLGKGDESPAATIKGGVVNISGERMLVGKDYYFLTVEGRESGAIDATEGEAAHKGLQVDKAFQIVASNESYAENLLDDGSGTGTSPGMNPANASAIPKLFHAEGFYNANDYWVSLRRDRIYGAGIGTTPNQRAVGSYLDKISYTLNSQNDFYEEGDLFQVLSALDDVQGDENVRRALDMLSGSVYAELGATTRRVSRSLHRNVANRVRPGEYARALREVVDSVDRETPSERKREKSALESERSETRSEVIRTDGFDEGEAIERGQAAAPSRFQRDIWGEFVGSSASVEGNGLALDYDYNFYGILVGADVYRTENVRAGAFFQAVNVRSNGFASGADVDDYDFGVYFARERDYGYFLGTADLGRSSYGVERRVAFGGPNAYADRTHYGDALGTQASFRLEQGVNFRPCADKTCLLRPFAAIDYSWLRTGAIDETGGDSTVTRLSIDERESDSLRTEIGVRLVDYRDCKRGRLIYNGRAAWAREYFDAQDSFRARFNNPSYSVYSNPSDAAYNANEFQSSETFRVCGVDYGRDSAWLGLGASFESRKNWTAFADYDANINNRSTVHSYNVGGTLRW